MSIRHTLSLSRPVWLLAALVALLAVIAFSVSTTAASQAPDTPSSVTLTRADGSVTASWDAPSGAAKYHVTYSDDGGSSWHAPVNGHDNITATSLTFTADNAKSYVVGVRAGNEHGWSGWRNSPSSGPYTPPAPDPTPTPTPAPDLTATPTPTPAPTPPDAVASVALTRADGSVTASWDAPSGAAKYHVTYSDDGGSSWRAPVDGHTNITTTSLTFNADNSKTYIVGVRAGNGAGWSGWRNSPAAGPYTPPTPTPTATPTPAPTATPTPEPTPAPTATPAPTPAPGIIVQDANGNAITALSVPEGGEAGYQVKLTSQPAQDVEVCVALSVRDNNDPDITFKGEAADVVSIKLTFTAGNWNTAQTVTLAAAVDGDGLNGARDVTHDAREYYSGHVDITATEVDNVSLPAAPAGFTATAGDGSVTLAWSDPSDSSITGYQYQVNHNDTGTGNFSGWGAWTAIANSGAATTSYTVTGLTNGREYRYHLRAVNAAGNSASAPNAAPWYAAATPAAAPTLQPPASVTVTRSDGAITASWPAVAGATGYLVEYSAVGNGNWITAAANHAGTGITINGVNNGHTYLVGVSSLSGEASNKPKRPDKSPPQVSPPSGPYSKSAPDAPPSVTVLRADGKLTAFWNSGWGAESYRVMYTSDGGNSWLLAAESHPVSNGVTSIDIGVDNANTYTVGVRAHNKNGHSAWRDSAPSGPYVPINPPPRPKGLKFYASDGAVTFIWDKPVELNNTQVTGYQAAYWLNPGNCNWPDTVRWYNIYGSNGDTDYYTITGLTNGKKYGVALRAVNQGVPGPGLYTCLAPNADYKPPPYLPPAPESLNVIRGDGTLTVTWHSSPTATGYQVNYSADGGKTWTVGAWWNRTTSIILRGMDDDATYTVKVRGRSDRGDGPWTESKTVTPVGYASVSNLGQTTGLDGSQVGQIGNNNTSRATGFRTGSNSDGYTLRSVTVKVNNVYGAPSNYTVAIHEVSAGNPNSTALHTLTGSAPTGAGNYTYTCSGSCSLDADTDYFLVLSAAIGDSGLNTYEHSTTTSDEQTNTPSGAGWLIADTMKFKGNNAAWADHIGGATLRFKVTAKEK